jgi:cardiolipin synthase
MNPDKKSILTLANKITVLRIILIPVIVIGMLEHQSAWVYFLLGFSMLTDLLDGLAARIRGERTRLGAFLDPMADKLLLTAIYITLAHLNVVPTWVFVVIFSRDLLIVIGWAIIFILTGSSDIKPRLLGKITTTTQMVTALLLMLNILPGFHRLFLWIVVAVTTVSAIDYIRIGEKRLGEWA